MAAPTAQAASAPVRISLANLIAASLPADVRACLGQGNAHQPLPNQDGPNAAQRRQINAIQALAVLEMYQPQPEYIITPAMTAPATWPALFALLPNPVPPALLALLAGPELGAPNRLQNAHTTDRVNAFLDAVAAAFPYTTSQGPNPRIITKEIAGLSATALAGAFDNAEEYTHVHHAIGRTPSAQHGTLYFVSPGANLTWPNHYINIRLTDMMERADAARDDNLELALKRIQDRAQQYFAVGWFDWHETGVYIRNGKTFIYDPSCISWNQCTPATDAYFQGMMANNMANIPPGGINSHLVAGIGMACTLWTHGFNTAGPHNRGRLGRRGASRPVYIGGGGNVVVGGAGECRPMVGNWVVMMAVLHTASKMLGLTQQQQDEADENLDWVLGGQFNGSSSGVTGRSPWWQLRCY